MKKIVSIFCSFALFFGLGSSVFAKEDDVQKAMELIEKTNLEIDEKIEKAVKKADELQADYLLEIRKIEEGDQVVKLQEEQNKIMSELETQSDVKKQQDLHKKLAEITAKLNEAQTKLSSRISEVEDDIEAVTTQLVTAEDKDKKRIKEKIEKLNEKLNEKSEKYYEKTEKYTNDLQKVITDIYDETLKMSAEAIKKAAEKGVTAECSWKLVRFADQWVWIDPIRVVKF
jgi:uncharacterized phage infection (PIP) family protein YhgE